MSDAELVVVRTFGSRPEAEMARSALDAAGIAAAIRSDDTGGLRPHLAFVNGVEQLTGATVAASDLRASAALVIAGLAARGTTVVESIHFVDRGYEKIEEKLAAVGAKIERAHQKPKISVAIASGINERTGSTGTGSPVVA